MRTSIMYVVYLAGLAGLIGCSSDVKPVPKAKPVVVSKTLTTHFWDPNELAIEVRNDGVAGTVRLIVYSVYDAGGKVALGESGIEKSLRETFTRDLEPQPIYYPNYQRYEYGKVDLEMAKGETKTVTIPLPTHNAFSSNDLEVDAIGILPRVVPPNGKDPPH